MKAAGVLCFRNQSRKSFLLLKHTDRWDLPKGHVEQGESESICALRELQEETGILADYISLDRDFRFVINYQVKPAYLNYELVDKTYVIFLGYLSGSPEIRLTEHIGFQWFDWNPPHRIQEWLIDPLLNQVNQHFDDKY